MIWKVLRALFMGALLVVFLPFVGFVMVFVALLERGRGLLKESPPLMVE